MHILKAFDTPHRIAVPEILPATFLPADCKIVLFSRDSLDFAVASCDLASCIVTDHCSQDSGYLWQCVVIL